MDGADRGVFGEAALHKAGAASAAPMPRMPSVGAHDPHLAGKGGCVTMRGYTVAILWRGDHQQRRDSPRSTTTTLREKSVISF
jgi:hypothetical protein